MLDSNEEISGENIEAIQRLVKKNVPFTVFTGRDYHSAWPYTETLGINVPVVLHNGALIMTRDGSVIRKNLVEREVAISIIEMAQSSSLNVVVYSDFLELPDMFTETDLEHLTPYTPYLASQKNRLSPVADILGMAATRNGVAQHALTGHVDMLKVVLDSIVREYGNEVSYSYSRLIDDWGFHSYYWERFPRKKLLEERYESELSQWGLMYLSGANVSKGAALEAVLEMYSMKPEEAVFIGDHFNDIPLMDLVGLPIAVANASDEVKLHCKMVVGSNNEHGVAQAINRVFFGE